MLTKNTKFKKYFKFIEYCYLIAAIFSLLLLKQADVLLMLVVLGMLLMGIVTAYSLHVYQKITRNLRALRSQTQGQMLKGNFFFSTPPTVKFTYLDHFCLVTTSVDGRFNLMLEFICQTFDEIEIRITWPAEERKQGSGFPLEKAIVTGEHKELFSKLLADKESRVIIESLLREFDHLYYGKDGELSLVSLYKVELTDPKKVLAAFRKVIRLTEIFKSKKSHETHL